MVPSPQLASRSQGHFTQLITAKKSSYTRRGTLLPESVTIHCSNSFQGSSELEDGGAGGGC